MDDFAFGMLVVYVVFWIVAPMVLIWKLIVWLSRKGKESK